MRTMLPSAPAADRPCDGKPMATSSAILLILRALDGVFSALVTPLALAVLDIKLEKKRQTFGGRESLPEHSGRQLAANSVSGCLFVERFHFFWSFCVSGGHRHSGDCSTYSCLCRSRSVNLDARKVDIAGALSASAGLLGVVFAIGDLNQLGWANSQNPRFTVCRNGTALPVCRQRAAKRRAHAGSWISSAQDLFSSGGCGHGDPFCGSRTLLASPLLLSGSMHGYPFDSGSQSHAFRPRNSSWSLPLPGN